MNDERDPRLSEAYRALEREEPPRALDAAIAAAARRAVDARPGAVEPRRWRVPLAAAAAIALAVAVALQVEREAPRVDETPVAPQSAPIEAAKQPPPATRPPSAPETRDVAPTPAVPPPVQEKPVTSAPSSESRQEPVAEAPAAAPQADAQIAAPPPRAPAAAASAAPERADRRALAERSASAEGNSAAAPSRDAAETPEQWLERIAGLRRAGKHDEADRALAQFRARYPEYRIADEMRRRVERDGR